MEYRFAQPLDVLYLRGNRLFGEAGEHAEAVMPPWPSLFAGALRSRMLVDRGVDLARFAKGQPVGDAVVEQVLGTPDEPGSFRVGVLAVAKWGNDGVRTFFPPPADLFIRSDEEMPQATCLEPVLCDSLAPLLFPWRLSHLPVLKSPTPGKATEEWWLTENALASHLAGRPLPTGSLVERRTLWKTDPRLGIALSSESRTVETGRLYTSDTIAFSTHAGFLVGVGGADGLLPRDGLLRLGGDGRGAQLRMPAVQEVWRYVPCGDRFRIVLSTPGLFPSGWCPLPLEGNGDPLLSFRGLEARLVAAAVPRSQVISGWDLARDRPKPAQRVVPAGAVYWFERVAGDVAVLSVLLDEGLWPVLEATGQLAALDDDARRLYRQRKAEGFNNVWLGEWASNE